MNDLFLSKSAVGRASVGYESGLWRRLDHAEGRGLEGGLRQLTSCACLELALVCQVKARGGMARSAMFLDGDRAHGRREMEGLLVRNKGLLKLLDGQL